MPNDIAFATKPEIALAQVREAIAAGVPAGVVLADAAYGDETGFRESLTELGLLCLHRRRLMTRCATQQLRWPAPAACRFGRKWRDALRPHRRRGANPDGVLVHYMYFFIQGGKCMSTRDRFAGYMNYLAEGLGHADHRAGLESYCTGLMLPLSRKSVEPMAARVDPLHASARHQALHHFVSKSDWSDALLLRHVRDWVQPFLEAPNGRYWIIDDTGFPKKGKHSVGVARHIAGSSENRTTARLQ